MGKRFWRPGHGVQVTLPPASHCRRDVAQLPVCLGGTRQDGGLPGTVRAGGFGPQQQGGASRLRQTRLDENSVAGRLRATGRRKRPTGSVNAATFEFSQHWSPLLHENIRLLTKCQYVILTYMNAQTNEIDGHIKNIMAQIIEAASKQDLAAIQSLIRKASEFQEMKEQIVAIQQRMASLNGASDEVPPVTVNQPTNAVNRQLPIEVTGGMIRQNLLTLARHVRTGKIKVGEELIIEPLPSGERFQTVLLDQGKKLRARSEIASFYRDAKVKDGDYVLLTELALRHWTLKKAPLGVYGVSRLLRET